MNHDLRQRTKNYKIDLKIPDILNLNLVDEWIINIFDIKVKSIHEDEVHKLVFRAMIIVKELFQSVKLPVYYSGEINSISHYPLNDKNFRVSLSLVYIDFIAEDVYKKIINFSFNMILWMMQNKITEKNIQYLHERCLSEIINYFLPVLPRGESRLPLLKFAYEHNIPFFHMDGGVYQLGWGSKAKIMDRSLTGTDSIIGAKFSENKIISAKLFKLAGLPAPIHALANNYQSAQIIAKNLSFPVVVKPIDLNRGEGVTINITDEKLLEKAFTEAMKLSKSKKVIVEKQVDGICHRLLIANNKYLYGFKRNPRSIKGNGVDTVEILIQKENESEIRKVPWKRKKIAPNDDLALIELKQLGLTFNSIPKKDVWVPLRDMESTRWGVHIEDCTDSIHPANIDIAIRATKIFGLTISGVDIITKDITKPWYETGAIINEINVAPHFGGNEIAISKLPTFFNEFIDGDGRIPIEVLIGNTKETFLKAKEKQKEYIEAGLRCYLTTHNKTYNDKNDLFHILSKNIGERVQSLLFNKDVDAIIIVIQNDEFSHITIPFDKVSNVTVVSKKVKSISNTSRNISTEELDRLVGVFKF